MLEAVFGNKTAQLIMLRLFKEEEVYAGMIAKDFDIGIRAVQNQLEKFENVHLLVSRKIGNVRVFSFNPQSSFVRPLKELIKVEFEKLSDQDREYIYSRRKRPRKKGKPIIKAENV
jgi:DNA-binding transcriptional ArsR family regulator